MTIVVRNILIYPVVYLESNRVACPYEFNGILVICVSVAE